MSEPHDVVKLLLARMGSHPEEFGYSGERWDRILFEVLEHGDDDEVATIRARLRDIRLSESHEYMMDELLNGPEKRRREEEEAEYERHLAQSLKHMKQQQIAGTYSGGGASLPVATSPYQNAMANVTGAQLGGSITASQIEPTLSPATINQIKKALGLKPEEGE